MRSFEAFNNEGINHRICPSISVHTLESASHEFFYASEVRSASKTDYDSTNSIQQFPETLILSRSHETYRDLFNDNMYFRQKWSNSEDERNKILQNERLNRSLLASGSADVNKTLTNLVQKQNAIIATLQQRLSNQMILQPFVELRRSEQAPLNLAKIRFNHAQMRKGFGALCIMDCFKHPQEKLECSESQDLGDLKRQAFSNTLQNSAHDDIYLRGGCNTPANLMVQSLVGAAVCEWVLKGKFQCTAMMNTPLLEKYRYHLSSICK